jgi:catechol 2,3-dioxygenase-like lactoylglutathione lyase family enzyme
MSGNQAFSAETICQIGFIVRDIERTAKKFCAVFGQDMPPIIVTPGHEIAKTMFKGAPSDATAKLTFFKAGPLQLELIEPDEKPSVWRDFLDSHGEGVHHIGFRVNNTGTASSYLAGQGMPVLQQGLYTDGSGMYTYIDSVPTLGVMVELLENYARG